MLVSNNFPLFISGSALYSIRILGQEWETEDVLDKGTVSCPIEQRQLQVREAAAGLSNYTAT